MAITSRADFLKHWQELLEAIAVNPALAHMEEKCLNLAYHVGEIKSKSVDQAIFKAKMQQQSRELEAHMKAARELATRLHDGIRMQYGRESEKLAEFRLQPRRAAKTEPAPTPQEAPQAEEMPMEKPPEPGPNPARTAAPGSDPSIQE